MGTHLDLLDHRLCERLFKYVARRNGCPPPPKPACLLMPVFHPSTELQGLGSDYSALILKNLGSK